MFKKILLVLALGVSVIYAKNELQDVVYLKNGSIIRGDIIERAINDYVKIQRANGIVSTLKMEKITKITKEYPAKNYMPSSMENSSYSSMKKEKDPLIAFVFSFFIPGLGQHYNGQHGKGIIQEVLSLGAWAMVAFVDDTDVKIAGSVLAGTASLWSMIDAPIAAGKINNNNQYYYGHLIEYSTDNKIYGFDMGMNGHNLEASFTIHF
ncbi:MAG: hypothetical protein U5N26_11600 [Candidatus Marinimicrobia bacterium]|nr:hypothetical protein [Candidatus Neomarinimicrobiota bacterium]